MSQHTQGVFQLKQVILLVEENLHKKKQYLWLHRLQNIKVESNILSFVPKNALLLLVK